MQGDLTLGGGIYWALHMFGDIAFRWVPATIVVVSGRVPDIGVPTPVYTPVTEPITTGDVVNFLQTAAVPGAYDKLYDWWGVLVALSIMLSLLLGSLVVYCIIRIMQIRHTEEKRFRAAAHPIMARDVPRAQLRWNHIQEQLSSDNQQNWRLAILEADIMLNELLDVLGYKGETMADKMKQVNRAQWRTIDLAWEAHRVRNQVAHQGSFQEITDRELRRVIGLYEQVFREHRFVD